jgi:AGZA family xanthine/uracil permease-like MFS transporter
MLDPLCSLQTAGVMIAFVTVMGYEDELPKSRAAFSADAIATIFGAFFGVSPVTAYIESGAGIAAGSRTGLTAIFCGFFFFLSIFFAPIIASIPPWASGGALIVVGCIMAGSLGKVKWHDPAHAATAFLTVIIMPLTYSIAYGLLGGLLCWIFLQAAFKLLSLVGIERPVFEPEPTGVVVVKPEAGENDKTAISSVDEDKPDKVEEGSSEEELPAKGDEEEA